MTTLTSSFSSAWPTISNVVNVILLCITIWQFAASRKEIKRSQGQVKIWAQDAWGIKNGLIRIVQDNLDKRYSSTNDMANAVWSMEAVADSLYQSLFQERFFTEKELADDVQKLRKQAVSNQLSLGKTPQEQPKQPG